MTWQMTVPKDMTPEDFAALLKARVECGDVEVLEMDEDDERDSAQEAK